MSGIAPLLPVGTPKEPLRSGPLLYPEREVLWENWPCIEGFFFGARPRGVGSVAGAICLGSPTVAPLAFESESESA
jgi:hypothetical protein